MADTPKRLPDGSYCDETCPYLIKEQDKLPKCKWASRELRVVNVGPRFDDLTKHPEGVASMRCADCRNTDSKRGVVWTDQVAPRYYGRANSVGNDYCGTLGERCPYVQTNRAGNLYVCTKYDNLLAQDSGNFLRTNACRRADDIQQAREVKRRDELVKELQDLRDRGVEVSVGEVAEAAGFDVDWFTSAYTDAVGTSDKYRAAVLKAIQKTSPGVAVVQTPPAPPRVAKVEVSAPKPVTPKAPPSTVAKVVLDLDEEEES